MTRDEDDDGESTWKHLDVEMRRLMQQVTGNLRRSMVSKWKVIGRPCVVGLREVYIYFN